MHLTNQIPTVKSFHASHPNLSRPPQKKLIINFIPFPQRKFLLKVTKKFLMLILLILQGIKKVFNILYLLLKLLQELFQHPLKLLESFTATFGVLSYTILERRFLELSNQSQRFTPSLIGFLKSRCILRRSCTQFMKEKKSKLP